MLRPFCTARAAPQVGAPSTFDEYIRATTSGTALEPAFAAATTTDYEDHEIIDESGSSRDSRDIKWNRYMMAGVVVIFFIVIGCTVVFMLNRKLDAANAESARHEASLQGPGAAGAVPKHDML